MRFLINCGVGINLQENESCQMVIKRRKHQWKQQKKIWNMGNTSTKVLSMK